MFMICNEHGAQLGQALPHWLTDYEIIGLADGSNSDRWECAALAREAPRRSVRSREVKMEKTQPPPKLSPMKSVPHDRDCIYTEGQDRRVDRWPADTSDNPRVSAPARFRGGDGRHVNCARASLASRKYRAGADLIANRISSTDWKNLRRHRRRQGCALLRPLALNAAARRLEKWCKRLSTLN